MKPKMSKRVLAALLVTVMVLATLPLAVFAEGKVMVTRTTPFYKGPSTSDGIWRGKKAPNGVWFQPGDKIEFLRYIDAQWVKVSYMGQVGAVLRSDIVESGIVTPSDVPSGGSGGGSSSGSGSTSGSTSSGYIEAQLLYETALHGKQRGVAGDWLVFGKVPAGAIVTVLKVNKTKDWARVLYHGHEGYIWGVRNLQSTGDKKPAVQQPTSPSEPNTAPNTSPNTSTLPQEYETSWKNKVKFTTCYTKEKTIVWEKPSTYSKQKYTDVPAGQMVEVLKTSGGWAAIRFNDAQNNYHQGYTLTKYLSKTPLKGSPDGSLAYDPNKTVKCILKADTDVYSEAKLDSWKRITTLASGTQVQAVQVKSSWAAILFTNESGAQQLGYVQSKNLFKSSNGSVLENWTDMNKIFETRTEAEIIDVATGLHFTAVRVNTNGSHADVQPSTQSDLDMLNKIYAYENSRWNRRACWVKYKGVYYAASMVGQIHGDKNVICIHFVGSKTHESDKVDPQHQAAIQEAYKKPVQERN